MLKANDSNPPRPSRPAPAGREAMPHAPRPDANFGAPTSKHAVPGRQAEPRERAASEAVGPLPHWITPTLIAATLHAWQPYYSQTLTEQDAIAMLLDVGRLCDVLDDSPQGEHEREHQ